MVVGTKAVPSVPDPTTRGRGASAARHKYSDAVTRRQWLAALAAVTPTLRAMAQGPVPGDPTTLSIAGLADAFAAGRLTPIDVTAAYLARIDRENPALGAFVTVTRERAVDDTRRVLTQLAARASPGPLAGVPIAHKDLFMTRGIRTTGGSRLHEAWIPERDAVVVARLADAGTVLLGKTNTHELGGGVTTINPFFGTTRNPHDASRIAGGSSGGSAAAVAARLVLAATGSDTGGSVRIPAALCGCVGLKPTFGRIPTDGLLGACPTFDHAGVLTRSVADAAAMLTALVAGGGWGTGAAEAVPAGPGGSRSKGDLKGLRIGVPRAYFFESLDTDVARAVDSALDRLRQQGAVVRAVTLAVSKALYDTMFAPIAISEIRATYAADFRTRPDAFSRDFAAVFAGLGPSAREVAQARDARAAFERAVTALFAEVDVMVTPTVPVVAPAIDGPIDGMRILRNTWPFNAVRGPAISVPCGRGAGGLPVGLQIVAAPDREALLLRVAAAVEAPGR
jgi:aspartyl-tRNA(Asn)/glutamyl-tRNA(Gln) amidotransferase subunit A